MTSRVLSLPSSSITSEVPSVLASTKMISSATVGSTASKRFNKMATLSRSFFVGTTTESRGSSRGGRRKRPPVRVRADSLCRARRSALPELAVLGSTV